MDNYDMFLIHESQKEKELEKFPVCIECHKPIQDERCYRFGNNFICEQCMDDNHKVKTEIYFD